MIKRQLLRVMIIDDSKVVLEQIRYLLSKEGFVVATQAKAFGSTDAVRIFKPNVVLMDVSMPGIDGDKLTAIIKQSLPDRNIRVILFSTRSQAALATLVKSCGAYGYIVKTADTEQFLREFHHLIQDIAG